MLASEVVPHASSRWECWDAAIATALALAAFGLQRNIGGGGFLIYHDDDGMATTFDFQRKRHAATERMYWA